MVEDEGEHMQDVDALLLDTDGTLVGSDAADLANRLLTGRGSGRDHGS